MASRPVVSKRAGLVLLALGVALGALLISPAGAHIGTPGHLWKTHIRPKADNRYVNERDVAYAFVLRSPSVALDPSRTKNFTAVSRPSTGIYCLTPIAQIKPTQTVAVATPEWGNSAGTPEHVIWNRNGNNCASGDFEFWTYSSGLSDNVAFSVYVA